ncbi:MAG: transaldolase [Actinomycetia bacterium]|nr:transaldolase [Actinomycetes bacterium]
MSQTRLHQLYNEQGQSPWLDNLKRGWITSGELERWVERGVRGITSNPSIFQKAIGDSDAYDPALRELVVGGASIEDSYWSLVTADITDALAILRPVYDTSNGEDGFVSVEVAPELADETEGTMTAARELDNRIAQPNLYVKIPGTAAGVPAVRQMIAEGRSINVTLLFSVERYADVIEAYLAGLEAAEGDLSTISSVASFFISRVDTEIDRRLTEIGTPEALAMKGKAAVANGKLAYGLAAEKFSGPRWDALAARGARVQRPLWASTSTKDPSYPDTLYVDELIGPDSVNTLPDATLEAFIEHGAVTRTVDVDVDQARAVLDRIAELGVDLGEVSTKLEVEGVSAFSESFDGLLGTMAARAAEFK